MGVMRVWWEGQWITVGGAGGGGGGGSVESVAGVAPTVGDVLRSELVTELAGTTGSDLAVGNHAHAGEDITSGTVPFAQLPTGTSGSQVAVGNHGHAGSAITSGTVDIARLPTGTSGTEVALGSHTHTPASLGAIAAAGDAETLWLGTETEYAAIGSPDVNTVYVVVADP